MYGSQQRRTSPAETRRIIVLLAALLAFAHGGGAGAQMAPLRLGDAYRAIGAGNPRVAAARALARAADARVAPSRLPPDPQLQLGFMNYRLPGLDPMDPLGMTQLQLMQMVPTAGKLHAAAQAAGARALAQHERASATEWELRAEVAGAFYDLYEIDGRLAIARETLRLLHDVRRTAEAMYRVGEGRQSDVLRAQVEVARMMEDTIHLTTLRAAAAARYDALLDRPGAEVGAPELPEFPAVVPPLEALMMAALSDRPMLRAGEREVEAAAAMTSLARREIWPDLTVGVQYGWRSGAMGVEHMGSLMLGASVPVFARGRQLQMREEAAAMRQMAAAELSGARAETRGRLAEAYANLTRARNLAALYRGTVIPQADAAVASSQSAYRSGGVDFMTLLDNRMTLNAYRQQLVGLEADEGTAWAEIEALLARSLFDPDRTGVAAGEAAR